ncbi:serine/threonine-protein kinase RsbT [Moorella thermoacetica]|uniref:Serine/threonine-protein kinase RsbT n=1 Tax=Neomoorella thermoacetica TaxID=1525 RepID=A0A1J5JFM6_NEOTH|nr:anti-sigma regulatory factor [Moorella thermoacetica]OIQ08318.1 serine/threonine-protein kinase RsbT [Moorella thermoacetica]
MNLKQTLPITSEYDIITARQAAREIARQIGFNTVDQVRIATAVSELTRNVVLYAGCGKVDIEVVARGERQGIEITVRDQGPGIADIELALRDGYSTSNGLGAGLSGARRLMDTFFIESRVGHGTIVRIGKWKNWK